ncbi:hypothetical protein ACOME3_006095 [Neoechinorhynchus agilis]
MNHSACNEHDLGSSKIQAKRVNESNGSQITESTTTTSSTSECNTIDQSKINQETAMMLRRSQIRESNREAARRCRERRRRHIEHLESLTISYQLEIKALEKQNSELRREILQLRAIILRNFTGGNRSGLATIILKEKDNQVLLPVGMSIPLEEPDLK